jgi:hypothetical protein
MTVVFCPLYIGPIEVGHPIISRKLTISMDSSAVEPLFSPNSLAYSTPPHLSSKYDPSHEIELNSAKYMEILQNQYMDLRSDSLNPSPDSDAMTLTIPKDSSHHEGPDRVEQVIRVKAPRFLTLKLILNRRYRLQLMIVI